MSASGELVSAVTSWPSAVHARESMLTTGS